MMGCMIVKRPIISAFRDQIMIFIRSGDLGHAIK